MAATWREGRSDNQTIWLQHEHDRAEEEESDPSGYSTHSVRHDSCVCLLGLTAWSTDVITISALCQLHVALIQLLEPRGARGKPKLRKREVHNQMPQRLSFAHIGGTLGNIDELPGIHDRSRHELESWGAADREARKLGPARRGAEHGDNLGHQDSLPTTPLGRRRKRRTWESPASFEHHDAYDLSPDAALSPSSRSGRQHRVICSFRISEGNKALRKALMSCICTCGETYDWIRRLGLPVSSIKNKLPYHRYRFGNTGVKVQSTQSSHSCMHTLICACCHHQSSYFRQMKEAAVARASACMHNSQC